MSCIALCPQDMPLSKVRGLGGKLGNELAELVAIVRTDTGGGGGNGGDSGGGSGGLGGATTPAVTAGDVQKVTMEALGRAVGERARWVALLALEAALVVPRRSTWRRPADPLGLCWLTLLLCTAGGSH